MAETEATMSTTAEDPFQGWAVNRGDYRTYPQINQEVALVMHWVNTLVVRLRTERH